MLVHDKDKDKEEGLDLCATLLARPMNPMPHHIASIGHWDPPKDPVYDLRRIHSTQQPVMSLQFKIKSIYLCKIDIFIKRKENKVKEKDLPKSQN